MSDPDRTQQDKGDRIQQLQQQNAESLTAEERTSKAIKKGALKAMPTRRLAIVGKKGRYRIWVQAYELWQQWR